MDKLLVIVKEDSADKNAVRPRRFRKRRRSVALEQSLAGYERPYNVSRMGKSPRLVAFPAFDKCDSLLFFPSSFTKCINSGDMESLAKLLASRIDRNCFLSLSGLSVNLTGFNKIMEVMNDLHPDSVMIVHTTKVVGNQIKAEIVYKYTDNMTIRKSLERSFPQLIHLLRACSGPRGDQSMLTEYINTQPEGSRFQLAAMLATAENVLVYGRLFMTLTFDDVSKRVTRLENECEFTSFGSP
jgi:hypothetical protein